MQEKESSKLQEVEKQDTGAADLDSEISSEISFLQEKIKERPVNRRKLIRRTLITVIMAVVFGFVACITFLLLEPVISRMISPEEEAEIVRFPEEEEEIEPEDMAIDEEELQIIRQEEGEDTDSEAEGEQGESSQNTESEQTAPENTGTEEGVVQEGNTNLPNASDTDQTGTQSGEDTEEALSPEEIARAAAMKNHQALYQALGELRQETEKCMVTVTTMTSDVNWINDVLENTGTTSGLIVADNGKELLILTDHTKLKGTENIQITFWDMMQTEAEVKEVDTTTGMAILSVPLSAFTRKQKENMIYASLGSSLGTSLVGQPVMAVGSPMGIGNSAGYGMVTSQGTPLDLRDSNYKLMTTDIYGSRSASGIIINMQGKVVGILYNGYENEDMRNRLCAIGISELKKTIERLSNGEEMVYLGVHGVEMNTQMYDAYELPRGAYVRSIDIGSPAMSAGVQSGDIITKVNDMDVLSHGDLVNILMKSKVGDSLTLEIARQGQGKGAYQEMKMEVTLKEQPK